MLSIPTVSSVVRFAIEEQSAPSVSSCPHVHDPSSARAFHDLAGAGTSNIHALRIP